MKTSLKIRSIAKACSLITICGVFTSLSVVNAAPATFVEQGADVTDATNQYADAAMLATQQNLRIVNLGSQKLYELTKGLATGQALYKDGSNQIVIVDSDYQDTDLLVRLLAKGNFVFSVGKTSINTTKTAAAMLDNIESKQKKPDSEYDANQKRAVSSITSGSHTEVAEAIVYGHFYSPNGSRSFETTEQNVTLAIAAALEWASKVQAQPKTAKSLSLDGWLFIRDHTMEVVCNYKFPIGRTLPAGKLSNLVTYLKKRDDRRTDIDFYSVQFSSSTTPGLRLPSPAQTQFRNNWIKTSVDVDNRQYFKLLAYGPTTTTGSTSFGVELSSSGVGASWGYSVSDVVAYDRSTPSQNLAAWEHNINTTTASGRNTVTVSPGILIRTPQDQGAFNQMHQVFSASYYAAPFYYTDNSKCQVQNYAL